MNITPDCYPCIVKMTQSISDLSGFNRDQAQTLMAYTRMRIEAFDRDASAPPPPIAARDIFRKAAELSKYPDLFDPYAALKKKANDAVMALYPTLLSTLLNAPSPLETAIRLSALGNILDFAILDPLKIDILKEVRSANDLVFETYDYEALKASLDRAGELLILGDNAGEIVFDKLFLKILKTLYPHLILTYAVRHRPVLNDITLKDAYYVGMEEVAKVMSSGSLSPGTPLDETSPEFNQIFERSDLIVAKGQGNFETLNTSPKTNIFFIFRVKCAQVAKIMEASLHSLVLLKSGAAKAG